MTIRLRLALAVLCATVMPGRSEAGENPLQGRWFVEVAYGERRLLANDTSHNTIVEAMSLLAGKDLFRIGANKVTVVLNDDHQACAIRSITDLGDVVKNLDKPFFWSGWPDYVSDSGESITSSSITGRLYNLAVQRCFGGGRWFGAYPRHNYIIKSGQNLFVYTTFVMLKLSKREP